MTRRVDTERAGTGTGTGTARGRAGAGPDLPSQRSPEWSGQRAGEPVARRDRSWSPFADGPAALHEVELSGPIPVLTDDRQVRVLVRLHGRPLGVVAASAGPSGLPARQLAGLIEGALGARITAHLRADGLTVPPVLPLGGLGESDVCRPASPGQPAAVVVTTCRASAALTRTLAGITAQTVRPAEIVVVDNRPHDSAVPALLRRAGLADIRYVTEPAAGLSRARNAGLAATSTPLVVFTDDDIEVDRRWLEFLLAGFVDPRVACATGLIMPLALDTDAQVLFERFGGFGKGFEHHRFDLREHRGDARLYPFAAGVFGSGANSAFRADVLRALGGFDIRLGAGTRARGGEDLDMHLSVVMAGHALVYEPAALVRHAHRRSRAQLRRQVHGYGIGLGAMVTKRLLTRPRERGELLRRAPHGLRHMFDPNSPKNLGKQHGYPRSLSAAELAGIVRGPGAYLANAFLDRPTAAATTVRSTPANRLIWCGDVELAEPTAIPPEPLDAAGEPYREARVLIRLHGTPLGFLHVDLDEDVLDDVTVRALAARHLGDAIRAHLDADGLDQLPDPAPVPAPVPGPGPALSLVPPLTAGHACRRTLSTPAVSLVVCTRDRPDRLATSLVSLRALDWPRLDVVIVDNAPTDRATQTVFTSHVGGDPRFRYVVEPRPGLSRARNAGLSAASGEIVAFTDDDVTVDAGWIRGLVRGFERRPDVACVTGLVAAATLESPAERYFDARVSWATSCRPALFDLARSRRPGPLYPYSAGTFGTGANMAFRRDVLRALGGFDEALGAGTASAGGEDLDVFVRVLLAGHAVAYEPAALVWHSHRAELDALRRQLFGYGTGLTSFLFKYLLNPATGPALLVAVPAGVGHLRASRQRTGHRVTAAATVTVTADMPRRPPAAGHPTAAPAGLPMRRLWLHELAGMAAGPACYLRSRYRAAHDRPSDYPSTEDQPTAHQPTEDQPVSPWT